MTPKQREAEVEALQELGQIPDARVVFPNGELKRFSNLVEKRIELKTMAKSIEEDVKDIDAKLTQLMTEHDTVKVQHSGYRIAVCQGSSSSLSKERLLQLGVTATVIAEATTQKTYTYLLVTAPKPTR